MTRIIWHPPIENIGGITIVIFLGQNNIVMVTYMPDRCVLIDHRTVMGHIRETIDFDYAPELASLMVDGKWCMTELANLVSSFM